MTTHTLAILCVTLFLPLIVFICVKASGEDWWYAIKAMLVVVAVIILVAAGIWGVIELLNEPAERPVTVQAEHP